MELKDDFICPSGVVARRGLREHPDTGVPDSLGTTYGINLGDLGANENTLKMGRVRSPSSKIMFTDSSDYVINGLNDAYWFSYCGINYKQHWDLVGDYYNPWGTPVHHGFVCYRHLEGAVIAYWDGHAGSLKKERVWVEDPSGSTDNSTMRLLWDYR